MKVIVVASPKGGAGKTTRAPFANMYARVRARGGSKFYELLEQVMPDWQQRKSVLERLLA